MTGIPCSISGPDELLVLEDDEPVRLIGLEHGAGPVTAPATGGETPGAAEPPPPAVADATPWRVVVYVSTELAGRFVLQTLCRQTAENAARLTALGPVDIVLADPTPTLMTEAGRFPGDVEVALNRLADDASGSTSVDAIRRRLHSRFHAGGRFRHLLHDHPVEPGDGRGQGAVVDSPRAHDHTRRARPVGRVAAIATASLARVAAVDDRRLRPQSFGFLHPAGVTDRPLHGGQDANRLRRA